MATPKLRRSLSETPSQILSTISSITSLLQTLNPQHPTHPLNPNPSILNPFSPHLNPHFVTLTLQTLQNPYHALFFFNWASNPNPNPNNYTHSHFTFIAITDLLISRKLFSLATELLDSHHKLSDFMVAKLIKAHGDLNHVRWALHLFDRVRSKYPNRCLFSYNAILGVLVRVDRVDLAEDLYNQMVGEGVVKPDVSTCTVMIKGFCKTGMIEKARKVFDEMPSPNLITYNTMVSGMCKKGLMGSGMELFERMKNKGCGPDTVTYTSLIDGWFRVRDVEKAKGLFDEMVNGNVDPNELTYNVMVNGLCLCGDVDGAKRMMTKMRLNGLKDTIATHTSLMKGYCVVGRSEEMFKHFKEMIGRGMKPDLICYEVLVNEYCKLSRPNDAIDVLRDMNECGVRPRACSFNKVLKVCFELGQCDRAVVLFNQMGKMGCDPNFLSYNGVICGLVRAKGRMKVVEGLVKDMVRNGFSPDANMYACLLEGYRDDGNEEMVIRVSQQMRDNGFVMKKDAFSATLGKGVCLQEEGV